MSITGALKDHGDLRLLPIDVRKKIYDFVKGIDLEKDDEMRAKGSYGIYSDDAIPGIHAVVSADKITVLMRLGVYDTDKESITDDMVLAAGIPRNDMGSLIRELN